VGGELVSDGISLDVDDRAMIHAVTGLGLVGMKAASRRAVLKTARLATTNPFCF
jgi:hypothetical protein